MRIRGANQCPAALHAQSSRATANRPENFARSRPNQARVAMTSNTGGHTT